MNEKELIEEIEELKRATRKKYKLREKELSEYDDRDGFSRESWWNGDIMVLEAKLKSFQEGKAQTLEKVKEKINNLLIDCQKGLNGNGDNSYWIGQDVGLNKLLSSLDNLDVPEEKE